MQYIRSFIFTSIMFLSILVYAGIIFVLFPFPYRWRYVFIRGWVDLNLWLCEKLCGLGYEIHGQDNIPDGNHIVYWKHQSAWETLMQVKAFPPQTWVFKRELMWAPFIGWALLFMRPIPVNRGGGHTAVEQVVRKGSLRIQEGMGVMVFPEGTRMEPGQTRRYGLSGALLALQVGRPIIPVAHNAGDFWLRRGLLKKPGTIRLVIGPPIDVTGKEPEALNLEVQGWIESKMGEISSAYDYQPVS